MNEAFDKLVYAVDGAKDTGDPGYYLHGDVEIKHGFPTHTHGLGKFGLPEMLINAQAFGPQANAEIINRIVWEMTRSMVLYNKVAAGEYAELSLWDDPMVICIRKVTPEFRGVLMAYSGRAHKEIASFAQVYVKGDGHVLVDDWYSLEPRPCPCEG